MSSLLVHLLPRSKHDYDLCEPCFKAQGVNPADYSAIQRPAPYRHPAQRHGYDSRLQGPFGMVGAELNSPLFPPPLPRCHPPSRYHQPTLSVFIFPCSFPWSL